MIRMRNNIVGDRVKLARLQYKPKLTQSDLAIKLELDGWYVGRAGIAKIEIGIRQVKDIEVKKLANALNVTISWLLGESK
jgi:transcriptional regulator with XRE-family HTH domain